MIKAMKDLKLVFLFLVFFTAHCCFSQIDSASAPKKHSCEARHIIKTFPASFLLGSLILGYKFVRNDNPNLVVEFGYVNSYISPYNPAYIGRYYGSTYNYGCYGKIGMKIVFPKNTPRRSQGRFLKFDLCFSNIFYRISEISYPTLTTTSNPGYSHSNFNGVYETRVLNLQSIGIGILINYGRQFVLGKKFTIEYCLGAGISSNSVSPKIEGYLGKEYLSPGMNWNYVSLGNTPLCFTAGLKLGYILN